jgi:hypothetical protein
MPRYSMYPAQVSTELSWLDQVLALRSTFRAGVGSFRGFRWELDRSFGRFDSFVGIGYRTRTEKFDVGP